MRFTYRRIYFHAVLFGMMQLIAGIFLIACRPGALASVIVGAGIAIISWLISAAIYPMEMIE